MKKTLTLLLLVLALFLLAAAAGAEYVHDPRLNPAAMADIVWDPDAVYGYSPSPTEASLSTSPSTGPTPSSSTAKTAGRPGSPTTRAFSTCISSSTT